MDLKQEVNQRVAELMRTSYERGFQDGAQSALKELEDVAADAAKGGLADPPRRSKSAATSKAARGKVRKAETPGPTEPKAKASQPKRKTGKPKSQVVTDVIAQMLAEKGEVRRDAALAAAQAENPAVTKFDLGNALRAMVKASKVQVSSEDTGLLLPVTAKADSPAVQ